MDKVAIGGRYCKHIICCKYQEARENLHCFEQNVAKLLYSN